MSRRPLRLSTPALRAAVVAVAAAGYLLALGATAWGAGLALVPHLALDHAPIEAPTLVDVPPSTEVLTTLRPRVHSHGGEAHTHAPPRRAAWPTVRADAPRDEGWHVHDGEAHRHAPDPPASEAPVVVVDKHRLPGATALPAPPPTAAAWETEETTAASVAQSVETPPPVGRS